MNNKYALFFFLSLWGLAPLCVKAQSRLTYALTFSPTWHHRDLAVNSSAGQSLVDPAVASHQGYAVGLTTCYRFTSRWSLSAGLLFNNSSGSFYVGQAESYAEKLQRLQLPLLVNYRLSTRRLSPYLSAGFLVDYLYHVKRITLQGARPGFVYDQDVPLGDPTNFTPYAMLGLGIYYQIMPKLAIILQPTGAYSLKKSSSYVSRYHDYQLGVQTQVKLSF